MQTGNRAQDTANTQQQFQYQQWLNNLQMPGQLLAQQAGILGGLPHGGTTTGQQTQTSYSSPLMGALGLGLSVAGMGIPGGGTLGGGMFKSAFPSLFS
jgi:hypothetical protein